MSFFLSFFPSFFLFFFLVDEESLVIFSDHPRDDGGLCARRLPRPRHGAGLSLPLPGPCAWRFGALSHEDFVGPLGEITTVGKMLIAGDTSVPGTMSCMDPLI